MKHSVGVSVVDQSFSLFAPRAWVFVALIVVAVIGRRVCADRVLQQFAEPGFSAVAPEVVRHATTNKAVESNGRGGMCRSFHIFRELWEVAGRRRPPVPHLLRSADMPIRA